MSGRLFSLFDIMILGSLAGTSFFRHRHLIGSLFSLALERAFTGLLMFLSLLGWPDLEDVSNLMELRCGFNKLELFLSFSCIEL